MYTLFIDTSYKFCHLGLYKNQELIKSISIETKNNLTDLVVEHLDQLLNVDKQKINYIYFVNGPGSFTGVRVSLLIVKAWKITNPSVKVYVIDSLKIQQTTPNNICLLDASGPYDFCSVFINSQPVINQQMINKNETKKLIAQYHDCFVNQNYQDINIFDQVIKHINDFKLVDDLESFAPYYVKPAINY